MNAKSNAIESFDQIVADRINVINGMKTSVIWRQVDSALVHAASTIQTFNAALAKTLPVIKKQQYARDLNGVRDGKYIKFPDGSQARY